VGVKGVWVKGVGIKGVLVKGVGVKSVGVKHHLTSRAGKQYLKNKSLNVRSNMESIS
jgi:hypothetical protein